jgi:hypothetical protein
MISDRGDRDVQSFLNAPAVALRLPANEVRTVVFEAEGNAHVKTVC